MSRVLKRKVSATAKLREARLRAAATEGDNAALLAQLQPLNAQLRERLDELRHALSELQLTLAQRNDAIEHVDRLVKRVAELEKLRDVDVERDRFLRERDDARDALVKLVTRW